MSVVAYERLFLQVVRGERRGPLAALLRLWLWLLSLVYGAAVRLRGAAHDLGLLRSARAAVPVLSVGNLTVGGTGKTPLVVHLARALRERGATPAVVARGYGAAGALDAHGEPLNDELAVVLREAPGVVVVAGADRAAGAARAVARGATVVLLDDGFQHRRLARDVDLVVVDATDPWGPAGLLPRGLLREPRRALRRASVVALTRLELAQPGARAALEAEVRAAGFAGPIVGVTTEPGRLVPVFAAEGAEPAPASVVAGQPVLAACGLGNPQAFARTLERLGARVVGLEALPDHHAWSADDVVRVLRRARELGAGRVVVTSKDAVKLEALDLGGLSLAELEGGAHATPPASWSTLEIAVTLDPPSATGDIIQPLLRAQLPSTGVPRA